MLRELVGHGEAGFDELKYSRQRQVDNVQLLTQELIEDVMHSIVPAGHRGNAGAYSLTVIAHHYDRASTAVPFPTTRAIEFQYALETLLDSFSGVRS